MIQVPFSKLSQVLYCRMPITHLNNVRLSLIYHRDYSYARQSSNAKLRYGELSFRGAAIDPPEDEVSVEDAHNDIVADHLLKESRRY